jgi:hypothetical protein
MTRDELLKLLSALPGNVDVGIQFGDDHLDITDLIPGDGEFATLRCHSADLCDVLVARVTRSKAIAAQPSGCSACGSRAEVTADGHEHRPARPSWDCTGCAKPWPCDPAREQLAAELRGTWLRIYLCIERSNAARDNPRIPAAELHERFIAWTWNLAPAQPVA